MMGLIENLEALLAAGREDALLRYGLGNACLNAGRTDDAIAHFRRALELNPEHSASWKLLGRALALAGDAEGAAEAYRQGIEVATRRGDVQAAKEMKVFLKRLERG
jgi:Flp pilus assembly protein TadD